MAQLCAEARRSRHCAGHGTQGRADAYPALHTSSQQHNTLRHVATRYSKMQHYLQHSTLQRSRSFGVACAPPTPCMAHERVRTARRMCLRARACAHCPARARVGGLGERCCASVRLDWSCQWRAAPRNTNTLCCNAVDCAATQCTALLPLHARCSGCSAHNEQRDFVVGVDAARLSIDLQDCVRICYFRQRQVPAATGGRTG